MPVGPHLARVLTVLNKGQPDRIPSFEWEVDDKIIAELVPGGDIYDFIEWADLDGVVIFADTKKKYLDSRTYTDEWGVTLRKTEEYYPIPIDYPIKDAADLASLAPPDPCSEWHFQSLAEAVDRFKDKRAIIFRAQDAYSIPRYLRGVENVMMDFVLNPGLLRQLVEIGVSYNSALAQCAVRLGADAIFTSDDYADNRGPMMSPRHFREFLLPGLKSVIQSIHAAGVPAIKHTDGNIMPILDDILSTGVDCIDPLDPLGNMSIAVVKEKVGTSVCIKGNVNIGGALSLGTPDEVRAETLACILAGKPGGAYILSTSNSIMSCILPANYVAMIETLRQYGSYEA
ncbi:MAG TPA: uroporphyrinogen decarboxylase family protein [Anaerolineales bacterium]|nr:uroporphyrinogen decarboxylase family protein [Anaerolineales bacterium]